MKINEMNVKSVSDPNYQLLNRWGWRWSTASSPIAQQIINLLLLRQLDQYLLCFSNDRSFWLIDTSEVRDPPPERTRLTQRVDHADAAHVQLEQGVVDGLPPLVVHEEVVEDGAQLGGQARQEVHHAQPRHADLGPGDVERQQHQEADQGDA